jgi:hypothetical protein
MWSRIGSSSAVIVDSSRSSGLRLDECPVATPTKGGIYLIERSGRVATMDGNLHDCSGSPEC